MCDLTMKAFEVSDKYRNPTIVLADLPNVSVVPNCYPNPVPLNRPARTGARPTLLMPGLMTYGPNADGAE